MTPRQSLGLINRIHASFRAIYPRFSFFLFFCGRAILYKIYMYMYMHIYTIFSCEFSHPYSDELPVQLTLPRAMREAKNRQQLSSLALLGQEFWRYPMANPKPPESGGSSNTSSLSSFHAGNDGYVDAPLRIFFFLFYALFLFLHLWIEKFSVKFSKIIITAFI